MDKNGKKKALFLSWCNLELSALVFMPNSSAIWIAAGLLWILDASINVSMEPFRAFVVDMLPKKQQVWALLQSFMIGAGAVIASALPWILTNVFNLETGQSKSGISNSVLWSFYIGAFFFLGAVLGQFLRPNLILLQKKKLPR